MKNADSRRDYDERLTIQMASLKACMYDEVSLAEFEELREDDRVVFSLDCRCGGQFTIGQEDLEAGFDLVSCSNCTARTLIIQ